jgi:hypothetical protein
MPSQAITARAYCYAPLRVRADLFPMSVVSPAL